MTKQLLNIIIAILLVLTIGLLIGYIFGYYRATKNSFPEVKFVDEINPGVATIKLMEVKNGKLVGEIAGRKTRIAYSANDILEVDPDNKFEIPVNKIQLKNYYKEQSIPKDAQFIASKNGKYYYSIFDKRALNLSPKNRIYFSNAKEAEKVGYMKR